MFTIRESTFWSPPASLNINFSSRRFCSLTCMNLCGFSKIVFVFRFLNSDFFYILSLFKFNLHLTNLKKILNNNLHNKRTITFFLETYTLIFLLKESVSWYFLLLFCKKYCLRQCEYEFFLSLVAPYLLLLGK